MEGTENSSLIASYLKTAPPDALHPGAVAFYASLDEIRRTSPSVATAIVRELAAQRSNIKLIASENYSSLATQLAQGNLFSDKYAEGYPGHRFYAGCENVDMIESEAAGLACELFGAEHAYVQPHSGADANLVAFLAILGVTVESPALEGLGVSSPVAVSPEDWAKLRAELNGQRLLAMDYYSGGHLSHGYRFHLSSRLFDTHTYTVDRETKRLDLDALRAQALEVRPRILLAGYSAYTREIDFARLREIADEAGAVLMVDMAHFAGLVAGKAFTGASNPVPYAQVLSSTTHKTLRGPRGGLVLCAKEYAEAVNKGCPTFLGGPLPHALAAKAVCFREALQPGFRDYAGKIVANARTLADGLISHSAEVLTGGTDNHMVLLDVSASYGLTGRQAEAALRECGLTLNRNALPFDVNGPWYTSGLRLGTPAITTLGMGRDEVNEIADIIDATLSKTTPGAPGASEAQARSRYQVEAGAMEAARARIADLLARYPVYPELDLGVILSTDFGQQALASK